MLAAFLGYQVISRLLLHTPLMSATNAISGISLVGSLVAAGAQHSTFSTILGFRRGDVRDHERGGRLHHHRSHAQDVQEEAHGNAERREG